MPMQPTSRLRATLSLILATTSFPSVFAANELPHVPDGFTVEVAASSPLVRHPMMAGFDDHGRLFIAESAGQNLRAKELLADPPNFVRMLEDTDDDGVFDKSTIFADKMTLPMGALWYRGALYVASPPGIWRLEDSDNDGVADKREMIVDSFGFSGNAASVHGCFLSPAGRIFWCDGRHGHEFVDENGNVTSKGKAARIFSCRPDGTDVRVHCGGGMDNPVEVDFTETGEVLGTVNILFGRPRGDCLMHWVEGGVYPRYDQQDCIAEFPRTGDLLQPVKNFGHIAVSGMTRYRSDHLGDDCTGNVFVSVFNTHRILRVQVERSGASFVAHDEDFLVSDNPDTHFTDVLEDADGSLLVIDTGGWFRIGCPASKVAKPEIAGAIYRIRRSGVPRIDDPRGIKLGLPQRSPEELVRWLDDARPAVREKTIDELALAGGGAILALRKVLASTDHSETARRNAVWALCRMENGDAAAEIVAAFDDPAETVRLAAATATSSLRFPPDIETADRLIAVLSNGAPALRREAARALQSVATANPGCSTDTIVRAVNALLQSLAETDADPVLEHSIIHSLIRIGEHEATASALNDRNPNVQRGALIAVDQMPDGNPSREQVVALLGTGNERLLSEALAVIESHPDWISESLSLVERWLMNDRLPPPRQTLVRSLLQARSGDAAVQKLISRSLNRKDLPLPESTRLLLLETIENSHVEPFPAGWTHAIGDALSSRSARTISSAIQVIERHQLSGLDDRLLTLASDAADDALRVDAIGALAVRVEATPESWFALLSRRLTVDSQLDQLAAANVLSRLPLSSAQLQSIADRIPAAGPLARPMIIRSFAQSDDAQVGKKLVAALMALQSDTGVSGSELERLLSKYPDAVRQQAESLLSGTRAENAAMAARLLELEHLLEGGEAEHGRRVFFSRRAACSGCHAVGGEGARVGPDLSRIGRIRQGRDLLEAIVAPSSSFARGFESYSVVTDTGRAVHGVVEHETTDVLTLRTPQLNRVQIRRDEIDEMRESPVSIMPRGLDTILTPRELQDLLAFLQSLR